MGQKIKMRAYLHNYGEKLYSDLRVYCRVNGEEKSYFSISLGPDEEGQVLFSHVFDKPGSNVVEIYADTEDSLKEDDSYFISIPVWKKLPVIIVNGDPRSEPLKGESDFLDLALRPYHYDGESGLSDLINTSIIDVKDLDAKKMSEARVLILANVNKLNDKQLKEVENFVSNGGGLLVFPGNHIDTVWYNSRLWAYNKGILPLKIVSLTGSLTDLSRHSNIVVQHYEHSALEIFNDPRNGNLSDVDIHMWYKLKEENTEDIKRGTDTAVLARLNTGNPLLAEKDFERGRVIQSCIPCDADWNNLPMKPFYLPLMQRLVTYLASKSSPARNVRVGKSLVAFLPLKETGRKAIMRDPKGKKHEVSVIRKGFKGLVEFTNTQRPGLYTLETSDKDLIHFVVNASREESNLDRLNDKEIKELVKDMGATLIKSEKEYKKLQENRAFGREIWNILLWLVLILVFAELILQRKFGRAKV
jgi:hypothetical protein